MPSRIDEAGHTKAFDFPVAEHSGGKPNVQFRRWDSNLLVGSLYLLCKGMDIMCFDRHSHCYVVKEDSIYCLIKPEELLDPHPLPIYQIHDEEVIALHHKVSCNI